MEFSKKKQLSPVDACATRLLHIRFCSATLRNQVSVLVCPNKTLVGIFLYALVLHGTAGVLSSLNQHIGERMVRFLGPEYSNNHLTHMATARVAGGQR